MNTTATQCKFANRQEAGRQLAAYLADYSTGEDTVILALPRGGVPVGAEVAKALGKPFDVLIVRKLGVPGHEELALGAIASGGIQVLNEDLISKLGIDREEIATIIARESEELLRREDAYRRGRKAPAIAGKTAIVVDDGIATGSTMSAAVALLRHQGARRIIVAVPVAPRDTVERLGEEADEVIAMTQPEPFVAVGQWYVDFSQTSDDEVRRLLPESYPVGL